MWGLLGATGRHIQRRKCPRDPRLAAADAARVQHAARQQLWCFMGSLGGTLAPLPAPLAREGDRRQAVALGVGHGGAEALVFGLPTLLSAAAIASLWGIGRAAR